jgi:hypothetical protein
VNNKALCAVLGGMFLILSAITTWYLSGLEEDRKGLHELLYRDKYLHGDVKGAPITVPVEKPVAAKK